jgi:hypothetical protein
MIQSLTSAVALAALLVACQSGGYSSGGDVAAGSAATGLAVGANYYLQTNLHADPSDNQLYSTNYQQAVLLPVGTEVTVVGVSRREMQFTVVETGVTYKYTLDRHLQESFSANLDRYFGTEDPSAKVAGMSEVDQEGIRLGIAQVGMTKDGVILACGYPPDHRTPSTDAATWTYWKNRWATRILYFDADGKLTRIQE